MAVPDPDLRAALRRHLQAVDGAACVGQLGLRWDNARLQAWKADVLFIGTSWVDHLDGPGDGRSLPGMSAVRVIAVGPPDDTAAVESSAARGCRGYLATPVTPAQFRATLHFVLATPPVRATPHPWSNGGPSCHNGSCPARCARERRVLGCLIKGQHYHEIAATLHLTPTLIHKLVHRIYVRLGAHTRLGVVQHCWTCALPCRLHPLEPGSIPGPRSR